VRVCPPAASYVYHDLMDTVNPALREIILRVIREQIRESEPPETKGTFDRLRRAGHSAQEAYRLLGCVLTAEIYDIERGRARLTGSAMSSAWNNCHNCPGTSPFEAACPWRRVSDRDLRARGFTGGSELPSGT